MQATWRAVSPFAFFLSMLRGLPLLAVFKEEFRWLWFFCLLFGILEVFLEDVVTETSPVLTHMGRLRLDVFLQKKSEYHTYEWSEQQMQERTNIHAGFSLLPNPLKYHDTKVIVLISYVGMWKSHLQVIVFKYCT